jgi:hypothetical protein
VAVILPAHQIDNLRRAAGDAVEAFDDIQRLLESENDPAIPSLVRSLGQEDLHHEALVILVTPRPLRLAGLLPVVVVPGWLVIRRPQGRVVRRRPRCVRWG